jgi:hypothetical protein
MKWLTALLLGAIVGVVLPLMFIGVWMDSFAAWGTIRPLPGSPGLLFSIPLFALAAFAFRAFFNWHK